MTIFIKAAKMLMLQCLDHSMEEASAKNLGWFGPLRNAELCSEQKNLTLKLRKFIDEFDQEELDERNLITLKAKITELDSEVESKRKQYGYERGHLNDTLTKMNSDLERFYNVISLLAFPLNDIEDDSNPFHILCSHAAYYFGENIFYPADEGAFFKVITSAVGVSTVSVRELKEACLLKHLKIAKTNFLAVKEESEYDHLRKDLILAEIEAIQRENTDICKQAQPIPTIPVSLSLFATAQVKAPTLKPSRGRLEVCMQHAAIEIKAALLVKPDTTPVAS